MRGYFCLAAVLSLLFCFVCPVSGVSVFTDDGKKAFSFTAYLGSPFSTGYIHSVQLCPVVDVFYVQEGAIWLWEERTQSTNAGLPTEAPRLGKFMHAAPWYRYLGGRRAFHSFRLRVGDSLLGRNVLQLPNRRKIFLFELFPRDVLTFRVK